MMNHILRQAYGSDWLEHTQFKLVSTGIYKGKLDLTLEELEHQKEEYELYSRGNREYQNCYQTWRVIRLEVFWES